MISANVHIHSIECTSEGRCRTSWVILFRNTVIFHISNMTEDIALYVVLRETKASREGEEKLYGATVNLVQFPSWSFESLQEALDSAITVLNEDYAKTSKRATYWVYYTILGNNMFLAKACRDALRVLLLGTQKNHKEDIIQDENSDPKLCLSTNLCILALREVENVSRSLYAVISGSKDSKGPKEPNKSSEIKSYSNKKLSETQTNLEFGDPGDSEVLHKTIDNPNFKDSDVAPEPNRSELTSNSLVDLRTALDIVRLAKDAVSQRDEKKKSIKSLQEQIKTLESEISKLETSIEAKREAKKMKGLKDLTDELLGSLKGFQEELKKGKAIN